MSDSSPTPKPLFVRLTAEERRQLEALAWRWKTSLTGAVRRLIRDGEAAGSVAKEKST